MPAQMIKFYQTGSFAVGNRLLDPEGRSVQADPNRANSITCGHRACQGCGEALGARYALDAAMRATDGQLIAVNATGCLEVFSTPYPETSWRLAWLHARSEEHTSELQSHHDLVCRLLLEKKKKNKITTSPIQNTKQNQNNQQ